MFDSNIFDEIEKIASELKYKRHELDFYVTSVQVEELAKIPDSKEDIRVSRITNLCDINARLVPTPFTFDRIDFVHFTFTMEPNYEKLLNESRTNKNDALIAASAIANKCILVTNDKDLLRRMRLIFAKAMSYEEFVDAFCGSNS